MLVEIPSHLCVDDWLLRDDEDDDDEDEAFSNPKKLEEYGWVVEVEG
jgi:hypothetical protein